MPRSAPVEFRSGCPIASTLDLIGDKWTLVLLRDLVNGKTRFQEFLESPERIASNILTARLAQMEVNGLIVGELYQERPKRYAYRLTEAGARLLPVLHSICNWAGACLPNRWTPPDKFMRMMPKDVPIARTRKATRPRGR
ncbi:MAG: helix-turn-helix domain-containing protein [Hyphomonadaceae bacterium]|nr:helix-turn-helix domain-containing protein [Hyphomonadaceae bacterium]